MLKMMDNESNITVEDAKQWIMDNDDPLALALSARRDFDRKHPIRWTEEREGGGVNITSAEWDFSDWSDQEIYVYALEMDLRIKMLLAYKDKPLSKVLDMFNTEEDGKE